MNSSYIHTRHLLCVQAFVWCFTYVHGIKLPWRISVLIHSWGISCCGCLLRYPNNDNTQPYAADGYDFYARPTDITWFQIPRWKRKAITATLVLSVLLHITTLIMHSVYSGYLEGQTWPGVFAQNCPFILSLICNVVGGNLQDPSSKCCGKTMYEPGLTKIIGKKLVEGFTEWWQSSGFGLITGLEQRREQDAQEGDEYRTQQLEERRKTNKSSDAESQALLAAPEEDATLHREHLAAGNYDHHTLV